MDKTIVGLIGALSGLAALDTAQAAPIAGPNATGLGPARSYAELLDPIPNAVAVLRAVEAAEAARVEEDADAGVQLVGYHHHHRWWYRHHHHHHHHHRWWYYHHHHHRYHHHHHHHHHHHRYY
jgi:hypothetical protein